MHTAVGAVTRLWTAHSRVQLLAGAGDFSLQCICQALGPTLFSYLMGTRGSFARLCS